MKLLFLAPIVILSLLACDHATVKVSQFTLGSDSRLHCPKCTSGPASLIYHKANQESMDCNSNEDGAGDLEHFQAVCKQCGFKGWTSVQDSRAAIAAQNGYTQQKRGLSDFNTKTS